MKEHVSDTWHKSPESALRNLEAVKVVICESIFQVYTLLLKSMRFFSADDSHSIYILMATIVFGVNLKCLFFPQVLCC